MKSFSIIYLDPLSSEPSAKRSTTMQGGDESAVRAAFALSGCEIVSITEVEA